MTHEKSEPIEFTTFVNSTTSRQIEKPFVVQHPLYVDLCKLNDDSILLEASSSKHSILIDCVQFQKSFSKNRTFQTCNRDQYPSAAGIAFRSVGNYNSKNIIEISFNSASECNQALIAKFIIEGVTIQVSKYLPVTAQVVQVALSQISHDSTADIHYRLMEAPVGYDDILYLGLYVSEDGGWFTGK